MPKKVRANKFRSLVVQDIGDFCSAIAFIINTKYLIIKLSKAKQYYKAMMTRTDFTEIGKSIWLHCLFWSKPGEFQFNANIN